MENLNRRIVKLISQENINLTLRFHLYCAKLNRPISRSYRRLLIWLGGPRSIPSEGLWRKMPAELPGSTVLNFLSTCWIIYMLVRVLLFEELSNLLDILTRPLLDKPGSCLLLGRMVSPFGVRMDKVAILVFGGSHLIWRSVQFFADHNFKLTALQFLFHSEHELERFYSLMDAQAECSATSHFGPSQSPNEKCLLEANKPPDVNELLLRHTMCYLVYPQGRPQLRLRPNRSREARHKLADRVIRSFLLASVAYLISSLAVGLYLTLVVLSDSRYAFAYPGCSRYMDELRAHNKLSQFGVSLPGGHRLLALLADGVENMIIWTDSGLAVVFVPTLGYLLNYDILLYWASLHARIETVLQGARERHWIQDQLERLWRAPFSSNFSKQHHRLEEPRTGPSNQWRPLEKQIRRIDRNLELEIHELQFEIFDFFNEVQRVDLFISDLLTISIFIWLVSWPLVAHNLMTGSVATIPLTVYLVELVGWCVIVMASYVLLELRRSCLRSYTALCSLMALDKSKERRHFTKVLEFFTQLNRTTYKVAHGYPYKPTTFITIMGWSASCFILTLTLFSPLGSFSGAAPAS